MVVSVSSSNRDNLLEGDHNCFNSSTGVPYEDVADIPSRKMKDEDIHSIASSRDGMKKILLVKNCFIRRNHECLSLPYHHFLRAITKTHLVKVGPKLLWLAKFNLKGSALIKSNQNQIKSFSCVSIPSSWGKGNSC